MCYVTSGVLTAVGGIFFASRLATAGAGIGEGLELTVITAAVLGGISLGGGKGSVTKALVGTLIVLLIINGLTAMSMQGGYNRMVLAGVLLLAAVVDIRWLKNRHRIVNTVYVSPTYHALPPVPSTAHDSGTPWALNDRLRPATPIGLGRIEGPEDIILARTTTSMRARGTETSSGSLHQTISGWKCSPILAAFRSVWRLTAMKICTSALEAWACIA